MVTFGPRAVDQGCIEHQQGSQNPHDQDRVARNGLASTAPPPRWLHTPG